MRTVLKSLRNGKASGINGIPPEILKNCLDNSKFVNSLTLFFNTIFNASLFPEKWKTGVIYPLYKGNGSPENPTAYKGITLLSTVSKFS